MVSQASKGLSAPLTSWEVEDFHNENPFLTLWEEIKACNSMYKFPKAPRWLMPIKDIHSSRHKDNEERKSRASIVIRLKVYQTYPVTRPNLLSSPLTQTPSPYSLFSDVVVPLVGILILTKAPSALHTCSMAITQPDAQHQIRLGANFVLKITISHRINVLIPTAFNQTRKSCNHIPPLCCNCKLLHEPGSPECSVCQERFLLMRKRRRDAFEARQARRNAISTPLTFNSING
jgi:hypothetical protein